MIPERSLVPLDDFDRPLTEASAKLFAGSMMDAIKEELYDEDVEVSQCARLLADESVVRYDIPTSRRTTILCRHGSIRQYIPNTQIITRA